MRLSEGPPIPQSGTVLTFRATIVPAPIAITVVLLGTIIVAAMVAVFGAVLGRIRRWGHRWEGVLLFAIVVAMIAVCYSAAVWLGASRLWLILGPVLVFLGLFTLLNAPFDWFSLGLTRALLRRGLELGGWWPYGLALVDACLAAAIIALLALTMVVGVQAFDALAVHGGGKPALPLDPLFNGIAANPTAPEYWWLYALLLSTMIPSLVNLAIGGTSLVRGCRGCPPSFSATSPSVVPCSNGIVTGSQLSSRPKSVRAQP
ncbi:MAG: hypothetical protein JO110_25095 [Acetobacteraceae bacterium]|nr:hypothetical protein [Acetobacteraceae bacterium]